MRVAVIGAMDEEVELLKSKLSERTEEEVGGSFFHSGCINNQEIILNKSGIGKVNAAMGTALLLHMYRPNVVINTGSAGGLHPDLEVGDLVISQNVRYNDVDATVFGYEYGQVPQMPAKYEASHELVQLAQGCADREGMKATQGLILSGDSFMSGEDKVQFLKETFHNPQCAEMEAGAIAQVCSRFDVPFVIIRALSDIAGKEAKLSFEQFLETASVNSANLILSMIKNIDRMKNI